MDKPVRDVTKEYEEAEAAAANFNPGEQPDIAALMRSAFVHGYAQALIDYPDIETAAELAADVEGLGPHPFDADPNELSECQRCGWGKDHQLHAVESQGPDPTPQYRCTCPPGWCRGDPGDGYYCADLDARASDGPGQPSSLARAMGLDKIRNEQ